MEERKKVLWGFDHTPCSKEERESTAGGGVRMGLPISLVDLLFKKKGLRDHPRRRLTLAHELVPGAVDL